MLTEKKTKIKTRAVFIHCIAPLFLGGLLYVLFRSTELRMFDWFDYLNVSPSIDVTREQLSGIKAHIPAWIYFAIPDGLWVYAFTSSLMFYARANIVSALWLLIPILFGIIPEILQAFQLFRGTFDPIDLFFTTFGYISALHIH